MVDLAEMLEHVEIGDPGFPLGAGPLRILHFSDLHWRSGSPGHLEASVLEVLSNTPADLVVFTGDTVNRHRHWASVRDWLQQISHPGLRVAVPGNWDYTRHGLLVEFQRVWTEAGFEVLLNRELECRGEFGTVRIVGLEDPRAGRPDSERFERDARFQLCLCHSPDILLEDPPPEFHLLLCGHTHGGQIRLPSLGALTTSTQIGRKMDKGVFKTGESQYVFIQSGLGGGTIPLRIGCPPRITLLTVSNSQVAGALHG